MENCLKTLKFSRRVTGHSFRAGSASFLKFLGFSDEFIELEGRCSSATYKEYINTRINFNLQRKRLVIKGKTKFKQMLDKLEEEQSSPKHLDNGKGVHSIAQVATAKVFHRV